MNERQKRLGIDSIKDEGRAMDPGVRLGVLAEAVEGAPKKVDKTHDH